MGITYTNTDAIDWVNLKEDYTYRLYVAIVMYVCIWVSLSMVVLNSRDWHENVWLPEFCAFQKQPFKITLL